MLIALIVFVPFIGAAVAAVIGHYNEDAGDYTALFVTAVILGLTILLTRHTGNSALYTMFEAEKGGEAETVRGAQLLIPGILQGGLAFSVKGFRSVYACITAIMWFGTTLFGLEYFAHERENISRYRFFVLFTLGAVEGVMLSADLMTAFVFFEVLSFTSFTWVIHEETWDAISAGYTYLFVAVIGGLLLFMGLILLSHETGTLAFDELQKALLGAGSSAGSIAQPRILAAGVLILLGFGAKAGMFPLHVWLPKAHPVAPSPGSALLSGILTKVGIYGILMTALYVLAGDLRFGLIVFIAGLITMFLGALLALFSINLKRTLACSSMSQIGFILVGIGTVVLMGAIGDEEAVMTALAGTVQHMINHSLLKLTLFMAAGAVMMNTHSLILDEIRGWGRNKILLKIAFGLGALGISGVPLFNGYISKTLLHEGIVEAIHGLHHTAEGLAEAASAASGVAAAGAAAAGSGHVAAGTAAGMLGAIEFTHSLLQVGEWIFLVSGGLTFAYMLKLFIAVFVEENHDPERQEKYRSSRKCMNAASTFAILGSSLFMVILGMPPVTKKLLCFALGNDEILHFSAFTFENLKGGLISLGIGAVVYLVIVRKVLIREDSYVNLWPKKLDLEVLLTPVCKVVFHELQELVVWFSLGPDSLIVALRRTLFRERKVRRAGVGQISRLRMLREGTRQAVEPVLKNFSFALLMTCLGILVILGVLLASILPIA